MLPRERVYYYNGKKYDIPMPKLKYESSSFFPQIVEPTTELQSAILFHVCVTKSADYKSIMKTTKRKRITALQSLKILIERHLIYQEKVNPGYKKSKLIFKATERGIFNVIGHTDLWKIQDIVNQIESAHALPSILKQYKERIKKKPSDSSSPSELIQEFALYMKFNDLFDEDGFSLIKEICDLWKHEVRLWMFERLSNKYFDIENLFGSHIRYVYENFFIPPYRPGLKEALIEIRKNLDDCIHQLST
ncbi:MAG: hypothetical protein WA941_01000 [Nitrososphaeraceae archaeon]